MYSLIVCQIVIPARRVTIPYKTKAFKPTVETRLLAGAIMLGFGAMTSSFIPSLASFSISGVLSATLLMRLILTQDLCNSFII